MLTSSQTNPSVCIEDAEQHASNARPAPKWTSLVDDVLIPLPRRKMPVSLVKSEAKVPADCVLVRDHNSPHDTVLQDNEEIDLGDGNVFYRLPRCDVKDRPHCTAAPKFAFVVDDRFDITVNPDQTAETLRELFNVPADRALFRDYLSPQDEEIHPGQALRFSDGSVFYTRPAKAGLTITVNKKEFTAAQGVKPKMTPREIAQFIYQDTNNTAVFHIVAGQRQPLPDGLPLDTPIDVHNCDVFDVIRCNVAGGYEPTRIDRELATLRKGGARVDFITEPRAACIYRDLPVRAGLPIAVTDVLVPVPSGYPGAAIDLAFLPDGSPLIGRVKGSAQEALTADGRTWRQISYHPHANGGGPSWDGTRHGFHTYIDELFAWLHDAK